MVLVRLTCEFLRVPGFDGVGMGSRFMGGTLTLGNRFRRYGGDCDGGIYCLG